MSSGRADHSLEGRSLRRSIIWWLGVFLGLQQAARLYLIQEVWTREPPEPAILLKTLWVGLRADLIMTATGLVAALLVAGLIGGLTWLLVGGDRGAALAGRRASQWFLAICWGLALFLVLCLTLDMGYYHYNGQHLDFVFFEYLEDLWASHPSGEQQGALAMRQTSVEMGETAKWVPRLALFFGFLSGALLGWRVLYSRLALPLFECCSRIPALVVNGLMLAGLSLSLLGFHPKGPTAIRTAGISSGTYYTLAQNPILYAGEAFRAAIDSKLKEQARSERGAGLDGDWIALPSLQGDRVALNSNADRASRGEALRLAQNVIARGGTFPLPDYPFVRSLSPPPARTFERPPNVLLLFVEALDRRYTGAQVPLPPGLERKYAGVDVRGEAVSRTVALTPFLDRLKGESLYFENFFSNGAQTARGLFASLCSYYPRRGMSVMKTRYAQEFLCLPKVLSGHGYTTEMVISAHRDVDRLHLFMARNGMQRVFDETDFPTTVARLGSGSSQGVPDGPLFDFVQERLRLLTKGTAPFLLTVKTLTTHHPFAVPAGDPLIDALRQEPDGYPAALRYFDQEFERFFTTAQQEGLLDHTLVLILGDHGRHEHVGASALEQQVGHFLTPLYLWVSPSLRGQVPVRPRTVSTVASQVDLTPTILSLAGLLPTETPFLGQDLGCLLVADCLQDNFAFVISPYGDELIGLADREGLLLYGLRTESFTWTDLALSRMQAEAVLDAPGMAERARVLLSLHHSTHAVLDDNRVWPVREVRARL